MQIPHLPGVVVVQSLSHVWLFKQPQGLQHASLLCPPLSLGVGINSCPLSRWCYLTISSSSTLFFFCCRSFSASGSFPVIRLFASGGQRIGASALVLLMNIQGWSPLGLISFISLLSKGLSRAFSSPQIWKHQFFGAQPSLWSNSHIHTWLME